MENTVEVNEGYETPTLVEVGGYAELTRGGSEGFFPDGGMPPYFLYEI